MIESAERRVVRLSVPRHLTAPTLDIRLVRLLDLSLKGARIEHLDPLNKGVISMVDVPPTLGRLRLSGRIGWTRPHKGERTAEGTTYVYYQSGLAFVRLTPEQQKALAAALENLQMAWATKGTLQTG